MHDKVYAVTVSNSFSQYNETGRKPGYIVLPKCILKTRMPIYLLVYSFIG